MTIPESPATGIGLPNVGVRIARDLFGVGGAAGLCCTARVQQRVPTTAIKRMLVSVIQSVAAGHLLGIRRLL